MYCSTCATPVAPDLSFCNRCGASLKEAESSKSVGAYLISAITTIGIAGLGVLFGGAIALKNGAQLRDDLIGMFMFMTFLLVGFIELFLCLQLSRVISGKTKRSGSPAQNPPIPTELSGPQPRGLPEPLPSVTENTTRTLEYSRDERMR